MLDSPHVEPAHDPEALQQHMDRVRADMVEAIEQLKVALRLRVDVRRQLAIHPLVALAAVAVTGLGVVLGVRRLVQNRRIRRTLSQLSNARARRLWIF
jgi:hypothetical protein